MSVIANTTVLSNFTSIGQLGVLRRLFDRLHISDRVYDEILAGLEEGYAFYAGLEQMIYPFAVQGWIRITSLADEQELATMVQLPTVLHQGEASCLAIARCRGWVLLTDDLQARHKASELGIQVSGTLGCLVMAVERGLSTVDQANAWLQEMIDLGYYAPVYDLRLLIK